MLSTAKYCLFTATNSSTRHTQSAGIKYQGKENYLFYSTDCTGIARGCAGTANLAVMVESTVLPRRRWLAGWCGAGTVGKSERVGRVSPVWRGHPVADCWVKGLWRLQGGGMEGMIWLHFVNSVEAAVMCRDLAFSAAPRSPREILGSRWPGGWRLARHGVWAGGAESGADLPQSKPRPS